MRISDWSSDVCSSDLLRVRTEARPTACPQSPKARASLPFLPPKLPSAQNCLCVGKYGYSCRELRPCICELDHLHLYLWRTIVRRRSEEHTSGTPVTTEHTVCGPRLEKQNSIIHHSIM